MSNPSDTPFNPPRSILLNGNFLNWGLGSSFTSFPNNTEVETADNWNLIQSPDGGTASALTVSKSLFQLGSSPPSIPPFDPNYYLTITNSTAGSSLGSNSFIALRQNVADVRSLTDQVPCVYEFWLRSATPLIYFAAELEQNFGTGGSPSSVQIIGYNNYLIDNTDWRRYRGQFYVPILLGKTEGSNLDSKIVLNIYIQAGSGLATKTGIPLALPPSNTIDIFGARVYTLTDSPVETIDTMATQRQVINQVKTNRTFLDTVSFYGSPNINLFGKSDGSSLGATMQFFNSLVSPSAGHRWSVLQSNNVESGGNTGSDFKIGRFSDSGSLLDYPFSINRATGASTFTGPLQFGSGVVRSCVYENASGTTIMCSNTSGIVPGMSISGSRISRGTTVVSIVTNTSVTMSSPVRTDQGFVAVPTAYPVTFGAVTFSLTGQDGLALAYFTGGIADRSGYGGELDLVIQNNSDFGNVLNLQNLSTQGFDCLVLRDDFGYDQLAIGFGNNSTGEYFANTGYIEMANGGTPNPFAMCMDGPFGSYGSGVRVYRRLYFNNNFTTSFLKQWPFFGVQLSGTTTNGSSIVTGLSSTVGMIIGMSVTGSGIPGSTTIIHIVSSTSVQLSANATASATVTLMFGEKQTFDTITITDSLVTLNQDLQINVNTDTDYAIVLNNTEYQGGGLRPYTAIAWRENGLQHIDMGWYNGRWQVYDRLNAQDMFYIIPGAAGGTISYFFGALSVGNGAIINRAAADRLSPILTLNNTVAGNAVIQFKNQGAELFNLESFSGTPHFGLFDITVNNDYIWKAVPLASGLSTFSVTGLISATQTVSAGGAAGAANSVWMESGALAFEGSISDAFETRLVPTNPTADRTIIIPDNSGTIILDSVIIEPSQMPGLTGDVESSAGSTATQVGGINGILLGSLATGLLKNTTTTGTPSIAVAGTDYAGISFANNFTAAQSISLNSPDRLTPFLFIKNTAPGNAVIQFQNQGTPIFNLESYSGGPNFGLFDVSINNDYIWQVTPISSGASQFAVKGYISATKGLLGTSTNDNAVAGRVGEIVTSAIASGSAVSLTTATGANVTSISLTAGDWDVEGNVNISASTATITASSSGISSTSATVPTDGTEVASGIVTTLLSDTDGITLPRKRFSLSGTTTVYLIGKVTFSAGTVLAYGSITARRMR